MHPAPADIAWLREVAELAGAQPVHAQFVPIGAAAE